MTKTWYIRSQSGGEIKGPFPGGQISQELLLGRHKLDDEVSHDKDEWFSIREVAELIPDIFNENRDDPDFQERLAAARRWADERRGVANTGKHGERRASSSYESEEIKRLHRLAVAANKKSSTFMVVAQLSIVFLVVITVIILAFQYSPKNENAVDCSAPAQPGINWSGCNLSGAKLLKAKLVAANLMNINLQTANLSASDLSLANLKYAQLHLTNLKNVNFTKADLKGANLMGADLSGALFSQADLSYANFRDAIVSNADFSNARFDNAIWVDGRTCGVNSVGFCK